MPNHKHREIRVGDMVASRSAQMSTVREIDIMAPMRVRDPIVVFTYDIEEFIEETRLRLRLEMAGRSAQKTQTRPFNPLQLPTRVTMAIRREMEGQNIPTAVVGSTETYTLPLKRLGVKSPQSWRQSDRTRRTPVYKNSRWNKATKRHHRGFVRYQRR